VFRVPCVPFVLVFSALNASAQTVTYDNSTPKPTPNNDAGKLNLDTSWSGWTNAKVLITAVYEIGANGQPGANPVIVTTVNGIGANGSIRNVTYSPLTSGKKVIFVSEVRDGGNVKLAGTQSGQVTVP
jgi:hypothetical protein